MMCNLWLSTVSLLGLTAVVKSTCDLKPTGCQTNNTENDNDRKGSDPTALNCDFENRLCCYAQGCVDIGMGNWTTENGTATVQQQNSSSHTCTTNVYSVLESPWVNVSAPLCVEFTYSKRLPYQLEVFLAFSNGTQPSLIENSTIAGEQLNKTSHFAIAYFTGKIQFRVQGGGGSNTSPVKLYYVRITEGDCRNPDSSVRSEGSDSSTCDLATTPPTTQHAVPKSTTRPTSSSTDASSSPRSSFTHGMSSGRPSETSDDDGGSVTNVGVVIGALVAAIAAVGVVIIVIVYRRKSQTRKHDGGSSVEGMSTSARDGDYTDIDAVGTLSQATAGNADVNPDDPYELAKDGAPGKTRSSLTDPFNNGASYYNQHQLNGTREDDYSCIDDTQPTAAGAHGMNTAPAKPDPRDVYSVVNEPGKKTPTPVYSLAKIVGDKPTQPNPNDVYSVVNKKGKKPDLAPKPGHSDTEYSTISHKGNNATGDKVARGATSDPYNRIGAVASLGTDGQNRGSTTAEEGSLVDDYNTLDFADTHQNEPRKEKIGAARAAYDHVHNDPDDTYNKTRIGKRNVVIGSDYDHGKPSN